MKSLISHVERAKCEWRGSGVRAFDDGTADKVRVEFDAGVAADRPTRRHAAVMLNLLDQGTASLNAVQIAEPRALGAHSATRPLDRTAVT
jgi:hypothetical protein